MLLFYTTRYTVVYQRKLLYWATTPASLGINDARRHGVREEPTVHVTNALGCSERRTKLEHSLQTHILVKNRQWPI